MQETVSSSIESSTSVENVSTANATASPVQMRAKSASTESPASAQKLLLVDKLVAHNPYSKALIIFSGAEGHVNFSDKRYSESKAKHREDICLLLWQCRLT